MAYFVMVVIVARTHVPSSGHTTCVVIWVEMIARSSRLNCAPVTPSARNKWGSYWPVFVVS